MSGYFPHKNYCILKLLQHDYDIDLRDYEKGIYYVRLVLDDSSTFLKKLLVSK